ncbi:MAG: porin [Alphaproteobacteria bacterium]
MNKKLLIAAVGAALVTGVGMTAAQADVKVSGYGHMSLDSIKGCKNAACTENSTNWDVSSNASNVVISANEDLGGGLKGIFQVQEFVRLDNNNSGNGALSGGNSGVGLGGDWGSVMLGNWDSGAKQNGAAFDLFNNQIGDSRNADRANNRVANLLWYVSPNMGGFTAMVAHSTNTNNTGPALDTSTEANSLMAKFEQGPLLIGVGYDKLSLGDGAPAGAEGDKWTNLGGKYTLPSDTSLILFYQKHDNAGGVSTADTKTMGIGAAQKFGGNNVVKFQYYTVKVEDTGFSAKPKLWALGFDHNFSKTFTGYVAYAQAKNESGANATNMSMAGGGHGDNPGTADGEKMSGLSFGAIYKF